MQGIKNRPNGRAVEWPQWFRELCWDIIDAATIQQRQQQLFAFCEIFDSILRSNYL